MFYVDFFPGKLGRNYTLSKDTLSSLPCFATVMGESSRASKLRTTTPSPNP